MTRFALMHPTCYSEAEAMMYDVKTAVVFADDRNQVERDLKANSDLAVREINSMFARSVPGDLRDLYQERISKLGHLDALIPGRKSGGVVDSE